jgi:hypothetical protein
MPSYKDFIADDEARAKLHHMVFHEQHTDDENFVPVRVKPAVAHEFLARELKPALKPIEVSRAADVARMYVARAAVAKFLEIPDRRERKPEELWRSIECVCVSGDLGDDAQRPEAAKYYDFILHHSLAEDLIPEVIRAYFHLDEKLTDKPVEEWLEGLRDKRKTKGGEDEQSDEYYVVQSHLDNTLPAMKDAKALRLKIAKEKDELLRAKALARTYIGLDDPGGIDWPKWAGFALLGEVERSDDANVVAGLRAALKEIGGGEDQRFVEFARARATRAIAFFGGKLTKEESAWPAPEKVRKFQLEI